MNQADEAGGGTNDRRKWLAAVIIVAVVLALAAASVLYRLRTSDGPPAASEPVSAGENGPSGELADPAAQGGDEASDSGASGGSGASGAGASGAVASETGGSGATALDAVAADAMAQGPLAAADDTGPVPPLDPELAAAFRVEPPTRDIVDLAVRMGRAEGPIDRTAVGPPPDYEVGDRETFWVHDIQGERYFEVEAALEFIGDNAYFWSQEGLSVSRESLERGGRTFSGTIIPKVREVFGTEWSPGVDGDARVHVLHHENIPGVAGYFSSSDELPVEVEPYSNEREMFYINSSSYRPGSFAHLSLLAHEFQHMVHYAHDRDEPVWVNEGLSDLAASIAGYEGQKGTPFFNRPDTGLLEWDLATGSNSTHYAASYAFFSYLRAQFGDEAITSIVAQPTNGPAGIEDGLAAIGVERSFDDLFLDWVVANRVHDSGRADPRFDYASGSFDWASADPLPADGVDGFVHQYATDYYDLTDAVSDGRLEAVFSGSPTIGLLGADEAADTGLVWWSNTGDGADSRLTRTFDLSGMDEAELSFRMWHALEPNWDYAYFLASRDGGETWAHLATDRTTGENPNGNNLGYGLTGDSWGWIDETLDLSPFAGGPVTVRFETVTDDAISLAGLALDDVRLDAVGFHDDGEGVGTGGGIVADTGGAETADDGWDAEGWLRIDPTLPQRWALQLIVDTPDGIIVRRVPVGADGTAPLSVINVPGDATVTLAISAMTPATRNEADYRLERSAQ